MNEQMQKVNCSKHIVSRNRSFELWQKMNGIVKYNTKIGSLSIVKIVIFQLKMKNAIVLGNAITHNTSKMKDKIKECEAALLVVVGDLTWRLQLLDISIKKVFNKSLRKKYVGYWIRKNKSIRECNHWVDWWVMIFRFYFKIKCT